MARPGGRKGAVQQQLRRRRLNPQQAAEVTSALSRHAVNIAAMQLYRDMRGGLAVMVLESAVDTQYHDDYTASQVIDRPQHT